MTTRLEGLPTGHVSAVAVRLRKALGCTATVDGDDVVLDGSLVDRVTSWLEQVGDLRAILDEQPATTVRPLPEVNRSEPPAHTRGADPHSLRSGTKRSDIRPGQYVAIVLKADQPSGKLTRGIVRDLLTSAPVHPRGIKVRLESGEVGRVKFIYE